MPLVINAKPSAVGLFQCSLAKDGIPCLYFHIFVLLTPSSAARFLHFDYAKVCTVFKNFFEQRNLFALLKQSICCCAVLSSIFDCGICVCALNRLEFWLQNLQLRFKLLVAEFALALLA